MKILHLLIQYCTKFNKFYALQKLQDNLNNYILLIDEPGQGLHEKAQEDVKKVIEDLATKGMQIVYSTHNPKLIDVDDKITRLRLVYQDKTEEQKLRLCLKWHLGKENKL